MKAYTDLEQKARAYDDALERARKLKETCDSNAVVGWVEYIFPELKESEDERIRKGIIRNLEYLMNRAEGFVKDELKKRIAWLEKQGQTFTKKDVDDAYLTGVYDAKQELEKQGEQKSDWSEENERVRKQLIAFLEELSKLGKNTNFDRWKTSDCANWIAWLEKQYKSSDQIHYWTEEEIEPIISDYLRGAEHYGGMIGRLRYLKPKSLEKQDNKSVNIDIESMVSSYKQRLLRQGGIENSPLVNMCLSAFRHGVENVLEELNLKKLEKQSEQKPFDYENVNIQQKDFAPKVELKFKVGDFIIDKEDGDVFQVNKVLSNIYEIISVDGSNDDYHIPHYCVESNYRLWTIQDAKAGDVLVGKIDGDKYIIIFKRIKDGWVKTYGHYNGTLSRFCVPSQLFCRDYQGTFTPATQEQRDLLFKRMKEAGYVWDEEKKKLKHDESK